MKYYCDTNFILRYLIGDNEEMLSKTTEYFNKAQIGEIILIIEQTVFTEVIFVLSSSSCNSDGGGVIIKIDLLKNHPDAIPALTHIWHDVLGRIWFPELTIQEIESLTYDELNHPDETTSFVALCEEIPVGFCHI